MNSMKGLWNCGQNPKVRGRGDRAKPARGTIFHQISTQTHTRVMNSAQMSTKPNGNGINLREYLLDERQVLTAQCYEQENLAVSKACSVREWCNESGREFAQRLATECRGHPQVVRLQATNESGTQRLPRARNVSCHAVLRMGCVALRASLRASYVSLAGTYFSPGEKARGHWPRLQRKCRLWPHVR